MCKFSLDDSLGCFECSSIQFKRHSQKRLVLEQVRLRSYLRTEKRTRSRCDSAFNFMVVSSAMLSFVSKGVVHEEVT